MKNKIILLFIGMLLMMSGVSALTIQQGQDENLFDYTRAEKGNELSWITTSDVDDEVTLETNATLDYDYSLELNEVNENFYLIIDNFYAGETYTISYSADLRENNIIYTFNATLEETGKYYYKFSPSGSKEDAIIYVDVNYPGNESPKVLSFSYHEEKPKGFNDLMSGFVFAFEEIIELNISLWKIVFYVIMFVIFALFTFGIFGIAFTIIKYRDQIKKKKMKLTGD